mmetsp:Transcript_4610/g.10862  ORF Transcript_4610/g.10862 Transcript_4610/m.10862 type:complete len:206 (+) Transcript_4610:176-793(+)
MRVGACSGFPRLRAKTVQKTSSPQLSSASFWLMLPPPSATTCFAPLASMARRPSITNFCRPGGISFMAASYRLRRLMRSARSTGTTAMRPGCAAATSFQLALKLSIESFILKATTRRLSPDFKYSGINLVKLVFLSSSPSQTNREDRLAAVTASLSKKLGTFPPKPFRCRISLGRICACSSQVWKCSNRTSSMQASASASVIGTF